MYICITKYYGVETNSSFHASQDAAIEYAKRHHGVLKVIDSYGQIVWPSPKKGG